VRGSSPTCLSPQSLNQCCGEMWHRYGAVNEWKRSDLICSLTCYSHSSLYLNVVLHWTSASPLHISDRKLIEVALLMSSYAYTKAAPSGSLHVNTPTTRHWKHRPRVHPQRCRRSKGMCSTGFWMEPVSRRIFLGSRAI